MSEYHYKYTPSGGGGNKNSGDELLSWIIIVIALAVFWPLGLFLLFRKLMGASTPGSSGARQNRRAGSTYHYTYTYQPGQTQQTQQTQQVQAESVQPQQSAPRQATPQAKSANAYAKGPAKARAGRGFIIAGSIVSGLFGFSFMMELIDALSWGGLGNAFSGLTTLACFTGIGLVLLYTGLFRRKRSKLFRKYLALIGRRDQVSISTLAKATGRSYKKVCDELQDMLDHDILPMGYLDLADDKLVLTTQGIEDEEVQEEPTRAAEEQKDDDDILRQIKAVNDSIPDPVMSAKIDRIGEITGKILDYQRKNPSKAGQLRSFLNYYLPTTLKILRAYAQLGQQGVEGENISAAKARIEGMMDKVVEGFEKQLDKLFQDDALDITSDVAVLEKMLDKDGLGQGGTPFAGTM